MKLMFHEADAIHGSRELPRLKSSRVQSDFLCEQSGQGFTSPASLAAIRDGDNDSGFEMDCSFDPHAFGQSTSVHVCHSLAETYAVPYDSPFELCAYILAGALSSVC